MSLRCMLLAAAVVAGTTATPAAAFHPDNLVVFGDSLVDAGNIFIATGGFAPSNTFNNPSRGYFPGRFTNGPDYTDLLSQKLYGHFAVPSLAGGSNYAFGGARIVDNSTFGTHGGDPVPDLAAQIGIYLGTVHVADPNALYVINAGGNDVFALNAGAIGSYTPTSYAAAVVDTLAGAVQELDGLGARHILVTGIPNIATSDPFLEQQVQTKLGSLTLHSDLLHFSYLNFFAALQADPAAFGVPAFTQPGACFDHRTPVGSKIDCSGFFSVDGVHPIAPIQAAIYREVVQIAGVPETTNWSMMIAGFGLIGAVLRRRATLAAA